MAKKVFIDPGHGGADPGAVDGKSGLDRLYTEEEDVNLAIGLKLKAALERNGVSVKMSRTGDTYPSLDARYKAANAWDADVFISIHCNSGASSAKGMEILFRTNQGEHLGQHIFKYLKPVSPWTDRQVRADDRGLAVLRGATMPAALIEYGFISNTAEEALLRSGDYQNKLAEATCHGIMDFFGINYHAPASAVTTPPVIDNRPVYWVDAEVDALKRDALVAKCKEMSLKVIVRAGTRTPVMKSIISVHCTEDKLAAVKEALIAAGAVAAEIAVYEARTGPVDSSVRRLNSPTSTAL